MRQNYRELKLKSDDELYELMLSEQPEMFDYQVCLHLLQLRHSERLLKKTWGLVIATWVLVIATVFGPYLVRYFRLD